MGYPDVVHRHRPRGLWLLDEPGGSVAADHARQADAAYSASGITFGVPGPSSAIPRAIATDGAAGVVTLPALPFLGATAPQAWEVWGRALVDLTTTTARTIFGNSSSTTQGLTLGGDATGNLVNEVSTVLNDAGAPSERTGWSGFTIPAGWHHHVWSYNGTQNGWSYLLDGVDITLRSGVAKILNASGARGLAPSTAWLVSKVISFFSQWGGIAAVAVYDAPLGPAAAATHYTAGRQ